jgi:predicted amidohydrolase YtcJ
MNRALTLGFVLVSLLPVARAQRTLFFNGHVFTADSADDFVGHFITEGGIITETGAAASPASGGEFDARVDLQGHTVVPGIVDSHIHFIDGALGLLEVSYFDVADAAGLSARMAATKGQLLDGIYVGRDLGYPPLKGIAAPIQLLDQAFGGTPAILFLKSGHGAVANTAAFRLLGYTARTRVGDGTIGIDANGHLTGYLFENAAMEANKTIGAHFSQATLEQAILKAQGKALADGITTIGDNTFNPYHLKLYQQLQKHGFLKMRVWARSYGRVPVTAGLMGGLGLKKLRLIPSGVDLGRVHYHAMKFFEDMSLSVPEGAGQAMEPGGRVFLDDRQLKDIWLLNPEQTFAFHVQGEAGVAHLLKADSLYAPRTARHRHVIDHAGYASPQQVQRIRDQGLAVTIIGPQLFDHDALARYYTTAMQGHSVPFREAQLLDARTKVQVARGALSSDYPYGMDTLFADHPRIDGLDPWPAMAVNVTGRWPDGTPIPGVADKTLTVPEAVRAYTANGAFVLGEEQHFGRLVPGQAADFVVLDRDIFHGDPMQLYEAKVLHTYIQGQAVYAADGSTAPPAAIDGPLRVSPSDYAVSPVIGYDPALGLILGGAYFRFPLQTPGSFFSAQLQALLTGQLNLAAEYTRYGLFRNTDLTVTASWTDFFQYYFGEGDRTDAGNYVKLYANTFTARPALGRAWGRGWHTDLFADYRGLRGDRMRGSDDEDLGRDPFPDEDATAIGLALRHDSRDNTWSTKKGLLEEVSVEYIPAAFQTGRREGVTLLHADLRAFHYVYNSKFVLAGRATGGCTDGAPSYLFRYTLGGTYTLRGYYGNRFRGTRFYAGQAEFRFPLAGKLSGAAFADAGDITDDVFHGLRTSYGAGIRLALNASVKLRLDYGMSNDQSGVFFTFGEAF